MVNKKIKKALNRLLTGTLEPQREQYTKVKIQFSTKKSQKKQTPNWKWIGLNIADSDSIQKCCNQPQCLAGYCTNY